MAVIGIVATFKAKPGAGADIERIFAERRKEVLEKEKGTLQYDLFLSKSEPDTYYVMEQYASKEALQEHMDAPYFKPGSLRMAEYRATDVTFTIMGKKSTD